MSASWSGDSILNCEGWQGSREIHSGGYVIDTMEAALWCLLTTEDFPSYVLQAVNLGSDTDTTGCVAGGLAGVCYGQENIPAEWRRALPRQREVAGLFERFTQACNTTDHARGSWLLRRRSTRTEKPDLCRVRLSAR